MFYKYFINGTSKMLFLRIIEQDIVQTLNVIVYVSETLAYSNNGSAIFCVYLLLRLLKNIFGKLVRQKTLNLFLLMNYFFKRAKATLYG